VEYQGWSGLIWRENFYLATPLVFGLFFSPQFRQTGTRNENAKGAKCKQKTNLHFVFFVRFYFVFFVGRLFTIHIT